MSMSIYMGSSPCGPTNSFESGGALGQAGKQMGKKAVRAQSVKATPLPTAPTTGSVPQLAPSS